MDFQTIGSVLIFIKKFFYRILQSIRVCIHVQSTLAMYSFIYNRSTGIYTYL